MLEFEQNNSILERIDPRTKLLMVVIFSVGAIVAGSWTSLLILLSVTLITWKIGKLSFRRHSLVGAILMFCAAGTIITQSIFYTTSPLYTGTKTVLFHVMPFDIPITGRLSVTIEGIRYGAFIGFKFAILILTAVLVPLTTHPSKFMLSLVKLRIPYFIVIIMSMGLRFVPLVQGNFLQLVEAQKVRGIRSSSLKGITTFLSSLLIITLRTARELALSLETRAFRPFEKRTFYRDTSFSVYDVIGLAAAISIVMFALVLFMGCP